MTNTPDAPADVDYMALIEALTADRPEYRHIVCVKPQLHGAVTDAKRALTVATLAKAQAEESGTQQRRKHGSVSPVEQAQRDLDAARAERDRHSVVFVLVPPTAEEEKPLMAPLAAAGGYPIDVQRATLLAGWRRTETVDGTPMPDLDRDVYGKVLEQATTAELQKAYRDLQQAGVRPDFS